MNSIPTRLGGYFFAIRLFSHEQFWGGHPNTFRGFFAWASLFFACQLLLEPGAFQFRAYDLMRLIASNNVWAVAFFIHWFAVSLVVLRSFYVRVGIQLLVNCYGILVWAVYIVLQDLSYGHLAINASAERVMVIYGFWALLRTGMNRWSDHK